MRGRTVTDSVSVETVAPDQVMAAREYIRRVRDPRRISDRIRAVASLPLDEVQAFWDKLPINEEKIQAAQLYIELCGGEDNVDPDVVAIAHAKPEV